MPLATFRIASILVVVLLSSHVKAEESEKLVVPVHPGWGQWKTITNRVTPQLLFVERIPETQNIQSIKDMLIEQTISGLPPQVTPAIALSSIHRGVASACESSRINEPTVRTENGYPVAYGQFYCTKQKGAPYGVVSVQKIIRGKEKLYVVQREWRLPPFEFEVAGGSAGVISSKYFPSPEALLAWFDAVNVSVEYLGKEVVVCDSRDENKVCPKAPQQQTYFAPPSDYVPLDQIRIKPRFDSVLLTKENLAAEHRKCVPFIQANTESMDAAVRKFPRNNATIAVGHASSSKQFIYRGSTGLCLELSTNRYPIYAAETFIGTANPTGVPPDVTDDWHMKIALKIAINGRAKVAYVTDKGTAFLVSYWSDQTGGFALNYWSEFKKVGEWESTEVDFKFSNPALHGFSVTKRGDAKKMVKHFPLATSQ